MLLQWHPASVNRTRCKLSFQERWKSRPCCVLQVSLHLHCELNSITSFSASRYHLLPLSSLPPNPCKSKTGLNSRSLICFSTCTSPTKARRSDVVLRFCSQTGLLHGMLHQELVSLFRVRKTFQLVLGNLRAAS